MKFRQIDLTKTPKKFSEAAGLSFASLNRRLWKRIYQSTYTQEQGGQERFLQQLAIDVIFLSQKIV